MASGVPAQFMEMQEAIKRNADDLREELAALDAWESEMAAKAAANKKKTVIEAELPPVRGTPRPATATKKPKEDPIATAKDQGNEYFRLCKFEDAARCYTKGINMDPDSSSMHVLYSNRAMCYIKLQLWDLAEKDATTCIQMNRTFVKGFFRRAVARKAMGKLKDARSDLETALVLSPGDKEAEGELKAVSALLLQRQREEEASMPSSSSSGAAKKKKLIIEEVEDEDDEPVAKPAAAASASSSSSSPSAIEAEKKRQRELQEEAERAESQRRAQEEARRVAAERAEKRRKEAEAEEQRRKASRRTSERIEELDDELEEAAPAKPAAAAPSAKAPKHADPAPPVAVRTTELTKASLTEPKSFVEFEQQHRDIMRKAPLLLEHFLSLLPSNRWAAVVGSSMSPEMLVDIFNAASGASTPATTASILCGVASLPRVQELVLFMDDDDKAKGIKGIDGALKAGAGSDADKKLLNKLREWLS